ncbi:MAG: acyl carrier protein [Nitrososphaeraceae archaeon]|nr:acyl carrier protein [Nitrososphaeraceae archaeon]
MTLKELEVYLYENAYVEHYTELAPTDTFNQLGIASAEGIQFVLDLEEHLGIELDPIDIFDHPTVGLFTEYVSSKEIS